MREMAKCALVLVITAVLDRALAYVLPAAPGVILAEPITIIAVSAAVTAAATVSFGVQNYLASQDAADAAGKLRDSQAKALKDQQDAANAQAAAQAVGGQTFGRGDDSHVVATGLGYGSGRSGETGFGRAQLTGGV